MIDVSDGLATDARHLAEASGVRIEIDLASVPLAPGVEDAKAAVTGGEDFELLFTVPGARWGERAEAVEVPLTRLGGVAEGEGVVFRGADGREVHGLRGYEHA
jgi:thiamine-monophosphate kinase